MTCPDLATARYLRIFGEIGLPSVLIPYEPHRTDALVPALEDCFAELKESAVDAPMERTLFRDLRRKLRKAEEEGRQVSTARPEGPPSDSE